MADTPVTSGSEIISNPGNAALGYSSGVAYNGNPADTNPLAQVDTTLNKLQDEEANFQVMKYQKRLQDQKDLSDMLANTGGSLFNVAGPDGKNMSFTPLPADKVILDQKGDELRKAIIANPSGYKYDDNILKQQQELSALKNHASQRVAFNTASNVEAGQTNDGDERQAILDNNQQEVGGHSLTDFHTPVPHLGKLSWTDETFHPKDVFDKDKMEPLATTTQKDAQGNEIEVNNMGFPIDKLDIRSNVTPGNGKIWSEANNMLNRFIGSPISKNPNTYIEQNAGIDRFNKERGLVDAQGNPISQHAIPHIADIMPDGTIVPNKNLSLPDFVYATTTPSHGAITQETKLKKDSSDLATSAEGVKKSDADIRHQNAQLQETIRHNKAEEQAARDKNDPDLAEANSAANTVLSHIVATRKDGQFQPLSDAIKMLPAGQGDAIVKTATDRGIDIAKYDIAPVNSNDEVVKEIAGVQQQNETGVYGKGVAKPEYAYYLKSKSGNPADDKYIIGYNTLKPALNEDGSVKINSDTKKPEQTQTIEWKTTTPQEAAGNVIKSRKNFDGITDKTTDNIGRAANKVSEALGGQYTPPQQQPATSAPSKKAILPAGATNVFHSPSGYTFYTDANGKKYKIKD